VLEPIGLARVAHRRRTAGAAPLLVIDAGFPPQVAASPVPGARLLPLDALRQGEDEAMAARREAVPAVEAMVDEAVDSWLRRQSELRLAGTIRHLHQQADGLTRELAGELVALGIAADEAERIVRRPFRRLLHEVVSGLRDVEAGAA
jgi:glutamyl-tRNA reductase